MNEHTKKRLVSQKDDEPTKLKILGLEIEGRRDFVIMILVGLALLTIGILVGVAVCFYYLSGQSNWTEPLIANAVRATIAAQPTLTPVPTYTPMPTYTPYSTPVPMVEEATQSPSTCEYYGIEITSHKDGATVGERFVVSGSYRIKPRKGSLLLVNKSPDSEEYWPSASPMQINETLQTWSGEFYIYGDPPKKADIIVAVVGKSGRALYEYYVKVGKISDKWEAINILTDDFIVCDQITVEKK